MHRCFTALVAALLSCTLACSRTAIRGATDGDTDEGSLDGYPGEAPLEVGLEWPEHDPHAPDVPSPPHEPQCGDGVLDEGEECDDRNRIDGDGCDWMCRLGDGEPPPDPDPAVPDYVLVGDPIMVDHDTSYDPYDDLPLSSWCGLPLVWTGSEYAASFCVTEVDATPSRFCPCSIRFLRFDAMGTLLDGGWIYSTPGMSSGLDLVWTGETFGLFFDIEESGIYLLTLDGRGKPIGGPVVVVPGAGAIGPVADVMTGGFVLAWTSETRDVHTRLLGRAGETSGYPGPVSLGGSRAIDVASGDEGYGVTMHLPGSDPEYAWNAFRFVWASGDLTSVTFSGVLSDGLGGDVVWADGAYLMAWSYVDLTAWSGDPYLTCVARFTPGGDLERAPVCTATAVYDGHGWPGLAGLAVGDGGLGLVWQWGSDVTDSYPFFMRTDFAGTPISAFQSVRVTGWTGIDINVAIAYGPGEYGLLFYALPNLRLQRIVGAE